ncbi:MAG: hypothetical protein JJ909_18980 [Roseivirga sp.]|jgi:hypothetical protein|uniref:hypothetical protein n=1 Tax=Roseivirga sp. TaxID=1964215 RepID=UPI001B197D7A|nr:hypothetical protein [Roseivirga sp.]MBO6659477.1 hypothetical protein [Roseivirga sp.]MBO6763046.1 hypothetical protein [Roseivirga sp.]MBO6907786.1 hypothetical protein [Roseivirga sp.]
MDIEHTRAYIKLALDKIEDEDLLQSIKNILDSASTRPLSQDEFYLRNKISRKAIESDTLLAQEEAMEYFKKKYEQG